MGKLDDCVQVELVSRRGHFAKVILVPFKGDMGPMVIVHKKKAYLKAVARLAKTERSDGEVVVYYTPVYKEVSSFCSK